ncbi:hypothetical protein [Ciceribacter sp. RN22]|uniref:hypothetical protein n=1 Tax=Ciceribacter sp. RN22 TaxID=2954932 RepID=UPI0020925216|nr:hypothetical protein [Ciceribacter sp. RN22]MCO6178046.1 hypothetical protein [Ciceribacter sp. RN22]
MIVDSKVFRLAEERAAASERPNFKNSRSLFFKEVNDENLTYDKFAELMLAAFIKRPQRFRFARPFSDDDLAPNFLLWVVFDFEPIRQEGTRVDIDTFKIFYPVKFADRFRDVTGVKLDFFELRFGCLEFTYSSKYLTREVVEVFCTQDRFDDLCASYSIKIIKYENTFLRREA